MGRNITLSEEKERKISVREDERVKAEQLAEQFYKLVADSGVSMETAKRALSRAYEIVRTNAKVLR